MLPKHEILPEYLVILNFWPLFTHNFAPFSSVHFHDMSVSNTSNSWQSCQLYKHTTFRELCRIGPFYQLDFITLYYYYNSYCTLICIIILLCTTIYCKIKSTFVNDQHNLSICNSLCLYILHRNNSKVINYMTTTRDNSIPIENVHCLIHFLLFLYCTLLLHIFSG